MRIIKERREGGCVKIYLKKKSDVNGNSFKWKNSDFYW
jgi:hypothetical protein